MITPDTIVFKSIINGNTNGNIIINSFFILKSSYTIFLKNTFCSWIFSIITSYEFYFIFLFYIYIFYSFFTIFTCLFLLVVLAINIWYHLILNSFLYIFTSSNLLLMFLLLLLLLLFLLRYFLIELLMTTYYQLLFINLPKKLLLLPKLPLMLLPLLIKLATYIITSFLSLFF